MFLLKKKKKGKLFRPYYCEKCKSYDFLSQKVILPLHKRSKVYDRNMKQLKELIV